MQLLFQSIHLAKRFINVGIFLQKPLIYKSAFSHYTRSDFRGRKREKINCQFCFLCSC